jgi:hypothetical protein
MKTMWRIPTRVATVDTGVVVIAGITKCPANKTARTPKHMQAGGERESGNALPPPRRQLRLADPKSATCSTWIDQAILIP